MHVMLDVLYSVATKASWLFNATWCIYNECVGHDKVVTEGDPADPTIVLGSDLNYPIWAPMNCQKDTLISSSEAANEYTRAAAATDTPCFV